MSCATAWLRVVFTAVACVPVMCGMERQQQNPPPVDQLGLGYGAAFADPWRAMQVRNFAQMSYGEIVDAGLKQGVSQGITSTVSDAMRTVLAEVVVNPVKNMSSSIRSAGRFFSDKLHGAPGLTAQQVFRYQAIFNCGVMHYLTALATGVHVVRARVLDVTAVGDNVSAPSCLYGIAQFKQDLEYLQLRLAQHLRHYQMHPCPPSRMYDNVSTIANGAIVAAALYAAWTLVRDVPALQSNNFDMVCQHPYKTLVACIGARVGLCLNRPCLLRTAHALSGVDRDLVCMLIQSLIQHAQHLAGLCGQMKTEHDVARLKEEFDRGAKHASETFVQLAQVLDIEQAMQLQRPKMNQFGGGFGSGSYMQNQQRPFYE